QLHEPYVLRGSTCLRAAMEDAQAASQKEFALRCRLEFLRLLALPTDYQSLAQEFEKMTGMQAPSWQPVAVRHRSVEPSSPIRAASPITQNLRPGAVALALRGAVTAQELDLLVARFDAGTRAAADVSVECNDLVRLDFHAAASLLHWAQRSKERGARICFLRVGAARFVPSAPVRDASLRDD
ncbi:MAG: hypothetical protein KGQ77_11930, partial [Betaproteobacteria bacterium]|nr:hypothetical protein [Betaproteobacteria bacterium]